MKHLVKRHKHKCLTHGYNDYVYQCKQHVLFVVEGKNKTCINILILAINAFLNISIINLIFCKQNCIRSLDLLKKRQRQTTVKPYFVAPVYLTILNRHQSGSKKFIRNIMKTLVINFFYSKIHQIFYINSHAIMYL